jgi:hypothetical protein
MHGTGGLPIMYATDEFSLALEIYFILKIDSLISRDIIFNGIYWWMDRTLALSADELRWRKRRKQVGIVPTRTCSVPWQQHWYSTEVLIGEYSDRRHHSCHGKSGIVVEYSINSTIKQAEHDYPFPSPRFSKLDQLCMGIRLLLYTHIK